MKVYLQVALDELEIDRAVAIAEEAVKGGVDWIEAGTPLIKSVGMDAVRLLKERFPDNTIVADMKTIDTGRLEVEMAAKSGADIVSILGASDPSVVKDALEGARKYGVRLMVDLIAVEDPIRKAEIFDEMGVDYLCIHVGIDQQMVGQDPLDILRELIGRVKTPIAVAGGLDEESASVASNLGASIVIVGGSIIRSSDVTGSAARIRHSLDAAEEVTVRPKESEDVRIRGILIGVSTSNISDAMHRAPSMKGIKPVASGFKLVGKAVTVQTFSGDWAKTVEATDVAGTGDVIVIYNGSGDTAPWGELATLSCKVKGIEGMVIDGPVRDAEEIKAIGLPVFSTQVVSNAGDPKGFGEINTQIRCGGCKVRPGDWIVGDDSGVMVIPKERGFEVAKRALEVKKMEDRVRAEILKGKTLSQVLHLYKWEKK